MSALGIRAGDLVGWKVLADPITVRIGTEVAAWYTEVEIPAGAYPILALGTGSVRCAMPGTVVAKYDVSLWGGNPLPSRHPQGLAHPDVGRPYEYAWGVRAADLVRTALVNTAAGFVPPGGRTVLVPGRFSLQRATYLRMSGIRRQYHGGSWWRGPDCGTVTHHRPTTLKLLPAGSPTEATL